MSKAALDMGQDPAAIRVRRRALVRQVRFASEAGECDTLEGRIFYDAGDALVTGEQGEHWPVRRAQFLQSYQPEPPLGMGEDGPYRRIERTLLAKRLDREFSIEVEPDRALLSGKAGDWLVQHEDGSPGIVAAALFAAIYDAL